MIPLSNDIFEKILLLDRLFNVFDVAQLREFTEAEEIVSILKGQNNQQGILQSLLREHNDFHMEIMALKTEIATLRHDFNMLTKLVLKPYDYNSASDAQILKSKACIY